MKKILEFLPMEFLHIIIMYLSLFTCDGNTDSTVTISEEFDYYGNKKYNKFKIYFTGNR